MGQLEQEDYEIKVTMTIQASILQYFSQAQSVLKIFDKYLNRHRELDFLKMRRFLHTTYNSLCEVDHNFKSKRMMKLYENMENVAKTYDDFATKCNIGVRSYHVVFLQQQERYALFETLLQHNLDEIAFLREQATGFKKSVQRDKEDLEKLSKQSSLYDQKESEFKLLKRRENSVLVRMGEVKEQNEILTEVLTDFRETYQTQFLLMYEKYTQNIKPKLLSILNAMAFEFDVEIWLQANNSDVIKSFFQTAETNETINSKTYLTYYLKGLDKSKMRTEHKELQKLLDYLNVATPIFCVIYMPIQEDLDLLVSTLEADDNGLVIHGYTDAKVALTQAFKTRIDILILDLEADESVLESFLSLYQRNSKQLEIKAKIMLVCNKVNKHTINKAELLGADSLIDKTENAYEIIDTVYDLLKVDNTETD